METNKLGVMEFFYKDEVECGYEGVMVCLDNNGKDNFDVDFLHAHPL